MSLTFQNFDLDEDNALVERGKEYFESGSIISLEETAKGKWEAAVAGTNIYNVDIKLTGIAIKKSQCTCRYFAQHQECKHVIAILYAIRERKANPAPEDITEKKVKEPKVKTPYQELQQLADKISDKDLREFVKHYALRNTDFTNSFLFFTKQTAISKEATEEGYRELIKLAIKNSTEKNRGYNSYINDDSLSKYLRPLTEQIKSHLADANYLEASYIIRALLGELSQLKEYTFSGDKTADVIILCFSFLESIAISDVSFMFKDELYNYSMAKSGTGIFDETIFESKFNNLLLLLATDNQKRAELLAIINEKIKRITPTSDGNIHINFLSKRLDLINTKINLLEHMKRHEEAVLFIKDNVKYHDQLRTKAVETAISDKDYEYAKRLVKEKINEKVSPHHYYRSDKTLWNIYLLNIAEAEKDKYEIVSIAMSLFENTLDIKYYHIAKKQMPGKEWEEQVESFLSHSRAGHNAFNLYYKVFREENMMERLFDLLKKNLNIYTLHTLAETLLPKFRKEVLALYKTQLNQLAENAESSSYNLIRDHLKHLINIGAADKAKEIIDEYRIRYRNRPAMIERLDKVKFK